MIVILLVLIPVILWAFRWYYAKKWTEGLEARIRFSEGMVYAGEQASLTEEIENRKRMPISELEAGFRIGKGVLFVDAENIVISDYVYKRDIFSLRGMEAVIRTYHLECRRRGRYRISQVVLRSWSFFHRYKYELELDGGDELLVYAANTDVSRVEALCDILLGEIESRRSLYEDPFTFAGIREYQPTDPMKQINWKATAKAGGLMVNSYASVRAEQFLVFLDVSDRRILKEEDLTEFSISAAASLCRRMTRRGLEIGLAVNTCPPTVFRPQRGQEHLRRIELFLTEDFADKETIAFEVFRDMDLFTGSSRDKVCVYISKENGREESRQGSSTNRTPGILETPVREDGRAVLKVKKEVAG